MEVLSFLSLKGGVGKTTLAVSLAADLSQNWGKRVLLVDGNFDGPNVAAHIGLPNVTLGLHDVLLDGEMKEAIYTHCGFDIIPGSMFFDHQTREMHLRGKLDTLKKNYDFILIDSQPSLGEQLVSVVTASDELFLVTTPDYASLGMLVKLAKEVKHRGRNIAGIVVNRYSRKMFAKQLNTKEIEETIGFPVVSVVSEDSSVEKALYEQLPTPTFAKGSRFSKEVNTLGRALVGKREGRSFIDKFLFSDLDLEHVNREVLRKHFYTSIFSD